MEVSLFREILSVTTCKMISKAIIDKTITPKIASDCRTLFDLFAFTAVPQWFGQTAHSFVCAALGLLTLPCCIQLHACACVLIFFQNHVKEPNNEVPDG